MELVSWLDCFLDENFSDGAFKGMLCVNQGHCSSGSHCRRIPPKIYTVFNQFLDDGSVDYKNSALRRQITGKETIPCVFIMPYLYTGITMT